MIVIEDEKPAELELLFENGEPEQNTKQKKRRGGPRLFPANTLKDSLRVIEVIRQYNAGNPWPPSEVAKVLELGPKGNDFFYLTSSARTYGLTIGTREASLIEIASLGRDITYATSGEKEANSLKKAFLNVDIFKSVYDYYKGGSLPELKYTKNTLESEFGIPAEQHDDFVKIYTENQNFVHDKLSELSTASGNFNTIKENPLSAHYETVSLGEPGNNSSKAAFVVMPFSEKTDKYPIGFFDEVLKNLITPAGIEAGFKVETAKREGSDIIHSTIVNDLLNADLAIVDLTEHNPNVLFELGLRIALRKPTCLIRARGTKPIFDVDNLLRVYDYDPNLWKSTIEIDVPKISTHIRKTWENKDTNKNYMDILMKG